MEGKTTLFEELETEEKDIVRWEAEWRYAKGRCDYWKKRRQIYKGKLEALKKANKKGGK